jgi:hypothetical protein
MKNLIKYNNPYMENIPEPKKQRTPMELADLIRNSTPYTAMDLASLNKTMPPVKDWPEFDGKD